MIKIKDNCHYILFTGLPGSGKSSTHKALATELRARGKTVLFRDDAVKAYNKFSLFTGMFRYMPFSKLCRVSFFWLMFAPPKHGSYHWGQYHFWRKKYCLWKRMVTSHVIIGKEHPDYFFDETIQVDFRLLDQGSTQINKIISLYPKSQKSFVVFDTNLKVSRDRVVRREAVDETNYTQLKEEWRKKESWLQQMYERILDIIPSIEGGQHNYIKIHKLDGESTISSNVSLLLKNIML